MFCLFITMEFNPFIFTWKQIPHWKSVSSKFWPLKQRSLVLDIHFKEFDNNDDECDILSVCSHLQVKQWCIQKQTDFSSLDGAHKSDATQRSTTAPKAASCAKRDPMLGSFMAASEKVGERNSWFQVVFIELGHKSSSPQLLATTEKQQKEQVKTTLQTLPHGLIIVSCHSK